MKIRETSVIGKIHNAVYSQSVFSKANPHEIEKFVEKIQPNIRSLDHIRAVFDAVRSLGQGTGV